MDKCPVCGNKLAITEDVHGTFFVCEECGYYYDQYKCDCDSGNEPEG